MPAVEALSSLRERSEHRRSNLKERSFYRPELDVLRFLAFLAVFVCHGLQVSTTHRMLETQSNLWRVYTAITEAGNFGVCMFLLLSSYLITSLLYMERANTNNIRLGSFYVRRILRIWPLYLTIIGLFVIGGRIIPSMHIEREQALAYVLLAGNWYIAARPLTKLPLNWLWTISVEEQFYLAWPVIAKTGGVRYLRGLSLLLIAASVLVIAIASKRGHNLNVTVWLNSLVQFQFFALGALLALRLRGKTPSLSPLCRIALVSLGAACWLTASGVCRIKSPDVNSGGLSMCVGYELVALGTVLLFLCVLGFPQRYLPRAAVYLGKISYGLYVFHQVALTWTTAMRRLIESELSGRGFSTPTYFLLDRATALALTIALAALSHKYLESPFLRMKQRFTVVRFRAA